MRISTKGSLKALASASGSFLLSAFHIQLGEIEGTSVRKREPGEDFSYLGDLLLLSHAIWTNSDVVPDNDALVDSPVPAGHVRKPLRHLLHLDRPEPIGSGLHWGISRVDSPRHDRGNPLHTRPSSPRLSDVYPSKTARRYCRFRLRLYRSSIFLGSRLCLLRIRKRFLVILDGGRFSFGPDNLR